ncbi:L,D-transpeptidase [Priestia megaterium]|jgi:lipoprotein-anchoring transpeptidase ErfK/SrfK|uniref:L,D-transpeptidase n=1 Tax=Priestia megaterium TaxID=1404 RepID=UPI002E1FDEB6|nr:L,D-transpeptidase [Priestia megaterium]MED4102167.1 L,D-transpeptidase [Priestia megaterium]MED4142594.1 L,D-transpeptidase [Priestia megaterium]
MLKKLTSLAAAGVVAVSLLGGANTTHAAAKDDLIIVNKHYNKLMYLKDGYVNQIEKVGTGKTSLLTPVGHFKVVNKVKNRKYYAKNIPGGAPNNPLGARWMGLNVPGSSASKSGNVYAIHGNANPSSIGGYVSAGCIRMYNDRIIKLYDKVQINTPVAVTNSEKSFTELAKIYGYKIKGYKTK